MNVFTQLVKKPTNFLKSITKYMKKHTKKLKYFISRCENQAKIYINSLKRTYINMKTCTSHAKHLKMTYIQPLL